jgi:starch-binding outer membrane protein, SusD/RagB family
VLLERRWELVMEGSRYHDLVRMGKLVEKVSAAKPLATPQEYHSLLPIPQRERSLNPNLTQNSPY